MLVSGLSLSLTMPVTVALSYQQYFGLGTLLLSDMIIKYDIVWPQWLMTAVLAVSVTIVRLIACGYSILRSCDNHVQLPAGFPIDCACQHLQWRLHVVIMWPMLCCNIILVSQLPSTWTVIMWLWRHCKELSSVPPPPFNGIVTLNGKTAQVNITKIFMCAFEIG